MKKLLVWTIAAILGSAMCGVAATSARAEEPAGQEAQHDPQPATEAAEASSSSPADDSAKPASETPPASTSASEPSTTEPSAPSTTTATPAAAPAAPPTPAPKPAAVKGGNVNLDFKEADIKQVLRIIALKAGVDIVSGPEVEGLVTIKLSNVPWEQALEVILKTYGYTYERKGNIVRVLTADEMEKEALSTEVFPLDYAKAKEVPDIISEVLSDRGKVKFDERTNTLIVTDIATNLSAVKQVVQRIDQRTPQVLIESKVVETRLTKDEKLGIDWSDALTLTAVSPTLPSTFPFTMGANYGIFGNRFIPRTGAETPRVPSQATTFSFGTLNAGNLGNTINFLNTRTDTHIVSNPSIAVLNNKEASVHIGEQYPIPNYTIDSTTGRVSISGYTAKNLGTILTVTPHVNPSNEIVVDLKPEIITLIENVSFTTGGSTLQLPRFSIQNAQTQVRIQSGDTIAIGGLVKAAEVKQQTKVPVLGDIPVVGLLFKNINRYGSSAGQSDPVRQDLLIFLTVKLLEEQNREQAIAAATAAE
ncbi:MAG: secretin and TonB N-terminal domain-containing protein [Candidatus Omnitrophica bacterium]|nr:secretin and TonB N-terminal domain-containing protein [Candidatus Omnitrophota bacterium]